MLPMASDLDGPRVRMYLAFNSRRVASVEALTLANWYW